MKKSLKYFSFLLFCSLFMMFVSFSKVDANYDANVNKAYIQVNKNSGVTITVKYQRGFGKDSATYYWCEKNSPTQVITSSSQCASVVPSGSTVNYVQQGGDVSASYIAQGSASSADSNLTTKTFTIPKINDPFLKETLPANHYYAIVVSSSFCAVRIASGSGTYTGCHFWDNQTTFLDVSVNDLINGYTIGATGTAVDDIEDNNVRTLMDKIHDVVHGTVMPIIWVVLGLFLVVKGSLLGVQIVKSADEPQVRQEKIGSLKWLVIGVGIAYASSFVVDLVIGFFKNVFR